MIKHDVPFFSQKTHIAEQQWQLKGCGITALKMLLEYWNLQNPTNQSPQIATLISKGLEIKSYIPDIGWSHRGLINIAHHFGYGGYNMDLPKISQKEAWAMLTIDLAKHPVIASVYSQFNPNKVGGHIVTLTGMHNGVVSLNDPEEETQEFGTKTMSENDFLKGWKQRYIVIKPL